MYHVLLGLGNKTLKPIYLILSWRQLLHVIADDFWVYSMIQFNSITNRADAINQFEYFEFESIDISFALVPFFLILK